MSDEWLRQAHCSFNRCIRVIYILVTITFVFPFVVFHFFINTNTHADTAVNGTTTNLRSSQIPPATTDHVRLIGSAADNAFYIRFQHMKKQLSSFHGTSGGSRAKQILNLCTATATSFDHPPAILPRLLSTSSSKLRLVQLNTFIGFQAEIRQTFFNSWIKSQNVDLLTLQELVDWSPELLIQRATNDWNLGQTAFLQVESGYHIGIAVRPGIQLRVLGKHGVKDGFHHGALHVEVEVKVDGEGEVEGEGDIKKESTTTSERKLRLVITHLSPADGHKRAREAQMLVRIANGEFLPDVPEMSGPEHVWVKGWNSKKDHDDDDDSADETNTRLHLPQGGKTTVGSLLSLGGRHRNVQIENICLSYNKEYWGRGDDTTVLAATIGDYIYGSIVRGKKNQNDDEEPLNINKEDYPTITLYFGNADCQRAAAHLTTAHPSIVPRKGTTLSPNVIVVGDVNSLSPSDAEFYTKSKLVSHIQSLLLNKNTMIHNIGVSLYSKFLMTTKNPNDAGTKYLKIDYRPVSILLEKGSFMDVLSMPSSPAAKNIQDIFHTVPTAIQEDYMHLQKMRLDAVLLRSERSSSNGLHVTRRGSIVSPCTELLSDHLPVLVELTWNEKKKSSEQVKRVLEGPIVSVCTEDRICQWRQLLNIHEKEYAVQRKHKAEIKHAVEWQKENELYGAPIIGQRGESCNQVCETVNKVCDVVGVSKLNTCDRVADSFPCWNGCSVQKGAVDAPAFDGEMNDDTFSGSTCVVLDVLRLSHSVSCEGRHPKTKRLCSCGEAVKVTQWSSPLESCSLTCSRIGLSCDPNGFEKINNCDFLQRMDTTKKCSGASSCRRIETGASFVPVRETAVGMCFVDASMATRMQASGKDEAVVGKALCEEEYGSTRERLCPCVGLKREV